MSRRLSRSAVAVLSAACAAAVLAACTPDPWIDRRHEAGDAGRIVGESTDSRVAICYAPGTEAEQLWALARKGCVKTGRKPQFVGVERLQCRAVTPHRAYFDCI